MDTPMLVIDILFVIWCLAEIIYFEPRRKEKAEIAAFDHLVLGVIDGLTLADAPVGLCVADLRSYVRRNLAGAHKLPDGEYLINYTAANGFRYVSHTGCGDHILFAVLCLVRYAIDNGNQELLDWCETHLESARRSSW